MADALVADHFSAQSEGYARFRPRYPAALLARLADLAPGRDLAWDCATGSGQAATGLARHFGRVLATDASPAQIGRARPTPGVSYVVATAERCPLAAASADLVLVAQALHWLDPQAFHAEVRRVLRPAGVVAAIGYGLMRVAPAIDRVIARLYGEVLGPYWPAERRHIEAGYHSLSFPYARIDPGEHRMAARWHLDDMLGYLRTWSAVQRFVVDRGEDPVALVQGPLTAAWGAGGEKEVVWPLMVLCGRV